MNLHTYNGWGSVPYWNSHVAVILRHGQGNFFDPRLNDATKFPVAARAGFDNARVDNDQVTPKLAALHRYQLALPVPRPSPLKSDPKLIARGNAVFTGPGKCAPCHVPTRYTEMEHAHRGDYHDGRFATLADVVNHYDSVMSLGLTADQKTDLQSLQSLPKRGPAKDDPRSYVSSVVPASIENRPGQFGLSVTTNMGKPAHPRCSTQEVPALFRLLPCL